MQYSDNRTISEKRTIVTINNNNLYFKMIYIHACQRQLLSQDFFLQFKSLVKHTRKTIFLLKHLVFSFHTYKLYFEVQMILLL